MYSYSGSIFACCVCEFPREEEILFSNSECNGKEDFGFADFYSHSAVDYSFDCGFHLLFFSHIEFERFLGFEFLILGME